MKINLHSHTQFCDGRSSMQSMVESAVRAGFSVWGFSPHAPICLDSPCNMKETDVPLYLAEIERLRQLYPQITILAGMEVDYIDPDHGPASESVRGYGLDYVIGSVHFIPNQKGDYFDIDGSPERFARVLREKFDDDLDYVIRTFWQQTAGMINAGGLDIVGHIDKIAMNASTVRPDIEETELYRTLAADTIAQAIKKNLAIEINTKHFAKAERFYPHPRYWKHIQSCGIKMPVNSDAHQADGIESGMLEAHTLLNRLTSKI